VSWDDAIDAAERLLRAADGRIVTALSGSETVEMAYSLGKLLRQGLGAHHAVLPEEISDALDAYRAPLSSIADSDLVVVLGGVPVEERAPIVELWIKQAKRRGAHVAFELDDDDFRNANHPTLIWSGPGGRGGATVAEIAERLGVETAFYLPVTPNGRGIADAWAAASDDEGPAPEPIGLLIVSGDEAASNPSVRALAEQAESVLAITMFHGLVAGWADLILPATSYLERDGTYVNLEGRLQRLRRASIPPAPDELAWLSRLAERFGVDVSPFASAVFAEVSPIAFGNLPFGEVGERAPLRRYTEAAEHVEAPPLPQPEEPATEPGALRLVCYRPLVSGPAVDRVQELHFQRSAAEVGLSREDARARGIVDGAEVTVRSNGTSATLRARVRRDLQPGIVLVPEQHAGALRTGPVEVEG
jgi:predicted molibdopterin-dependent oxidoreductase YjgC